MNQQEINDLFRNLIKSLADEGYKKTNVGKVLFGLNAFSQIDRFIKSIDNEGEKVNFGISPLTKIGNLLDYNLALVYIDPNDQQTNDLVYQKNMEFYELLKTKIKDYLDNNIQSRKNALSDKEKLHRDVDELLSLLDL